MKLGSMSLPSIVAALVAYLGIVAVGVFVAQSGVPDEASLTTLAGRLDGVRASRSPKTGETTISFDVIGGDGTLTSLHMDAFGRPEVARRLTDLATQGATVTVRYRKLPLGNRGFAVADQTGDVVSFADARRFLEAREAARGDDRWGFLLLYGGVPPLILLIVWWRGRSAPGTVPGVAAHHDEDRLAHDLTSQRAISLALLPAVVGLLALGGVPTEVTRVLGPRPLGLPPMAAYLGLTTLALAPLGAVLWYLAGAMQAIRRRTGRVPLGKWSLLIETVLSWEDDQLRAQTLRALAWFAAFILLTAIWIVVAG